VRGLELSKEKTKISSIYDGFNFLGQNIRKYKKKLLIKPSKEAVANLLDKTRIIIRKHRGRGAAGMVQELSPIIRGWVNYHKYSVCSEITAGAFPTGTLLEELEPYAGKLACPVLRGTEPARAPDHPMENKRLTV